jgi:hypothetical protein
MNITLLEIAMIHEFGAPRARIPERSFVRAYVDLHGRDIQSWQRALVQSALRGHVNPDHILQQLGAKVVAGMQERIANGIEPPLNPVTIERKGSSVPLIDTGQLRAALTWKVREL